MSKKNNFNTSHFLHSLYLVGVFIFFSSSAFSKTTNESIGKKVDFILDVANHISKAKESKDNYYVIGLYGQGSEFRKVMKALEKKTANSTIQNKAVKVKQLLRLKNIDEIDLVILSGDRKIKPSTLKEMLSESNYIVLTENYPFGVSALNYAINDNDDLIFEIQENTLKNQGFKVDNKLLKSNNRVSSSEMWRNVESTIKAG